MKYIFFAFFVLISSLSLAQDDYSLALKYYNDHEYEKAADIFWKLYTQRKAKFYFNYYLKSLLNLKQYDKAIKIVKKQIKKNQNNLEFYIDLGYVYEAKGDKDKSEKQYEYVLKNLPADKTLIIQIANNFLRYGKYQWAEKTYLKGKTLITYKFYKELGNVYAFEKNYDKFIDQYLNYLQEKSTRIKEVKSMFASYLERDHNGEFSNLLEKKIIRKTQLSSDVIFRELLIWFYVEKGDFYNAFIQARALDKISKNGGKNTYQIGLEALKRDEFETAQEAFEFVLSYPSSKYYWKAKFGILKILYRKVELGKIKTKEEIEEVENQYITVINQLGLSKKTIQIIKDLAYLEAFYLNSAKNAISLLKQAINIKGISNELKGDLMIELGDVWLAAGNPWNAILTYAKVEDNFKDTKLADKAKFKKAMTYFYIGEFQWAKDQFDVLKGSVSKLIANDAIYMASFIEENLNPDDSVNLPLKLYAKADWMYFTGKTDSALAVCDTLLNSSAADMLTDDIYFLKYKIYYKKGEYEKAAENLKKIIEQYPYEILADKAVYFLAKLYDVKLGDKKKAAEYYKKLLFEYKSSFYLNMARERYRELAPILENQ